MRLLLLLVSVGFHRYSLENFNGNTVEGVSENEVEEFDPPSEVRITKRNNHCLFAQIQLS